jgi:integrase
MVFETPNSTLSDLQNLVGVLEGESLSSSTRRAYASSWTAFEVFTKNHVFRSLPSDANVVALYVAHLTDAGRSSSTIARALTAISQKHLENGYASPTLDSLVRRVSRGSRRRLGSRSRGKTPLLFSDLDPTPRDDPKSVRDRALLLFGISTGLRRSEITALDLDDLTFEDTGFLVRIRRSKSDQFGEGRTIYVHAHPETSTCPLRAITIWTERFGNTPGPLFRPILKSGRILSRRIGEKTIERIVKNAAARVGLDPKKFGGHSLRSGAATVAALAGQSETEIARLLGHGSTAMSSRYVRFATPPALVR